MGASYGSIHIRTTDREVVRSAAEIVAKEHRIKCLLAPTIGGWTSLYPSGKGQDERPTHALAARLPAMDILHVVLHDDDVFAYGFFRGGKLLDEYNSCPDYFGEVPAEDHDRQRGRPERFADLLGSAFADVEKLLHASDGDATARFIRFAELFGLPNAVTSYEDLVDGQTEGITRFEEFIAIPEPTAERAAKRSQQAALKALKKDLRLAGVFLAEYSGGKGTMFAPTQHVCPAGASDFLVCWCDWASGTPCDLQRIGPSDWETPSSIGIQLDPRLHGLTASSSGHFVAAMLAAGTWVSELWDLPSHTRIATVEHRDHRAANAAFSTDESQLFIRCEDQLQCVQTDRGSIAYSINLHDQGRLIAVHPSEPYAVVDALYQPLIVDLEQRRLVRRLLIGGRYDMARDMATQAQWRMDAARDSATKELWRQKVEDALRSAGSPDPRERRGSEPLRDVAFSTDGRYLLIATDKGARAYEWSSVLAASENMPQPVCAAEAEPVTFELSPGQDHIETGINAVAYDRRQHLMLFAGMEGTVRSVDIASGQEKTVLEVPGRPPISQMHLSGDASTLVLGFKTVHFERSPKTPWWLQFWRYPLPSLQP